MFQIKISLEQLIYEKRFQKEIQRIGFINYIKLRKSIMTHYQDIK